MKEHYGIPIREKCKMAWEHGEPCLHKIFEAMAKRDVGFLEKARRIREYGRRKDKKN